MTDKEYVGWIRKKDPNRYTVPKELLYKIILDRIHENIKDLNPTDISCVIVVLDKEGLWPKKLKVKA